MFVICIFSFKYPSILQHLSLKFDFSFGEGEREKKKCFDAPCWLLLTWIRYVISLFKACLDESESRGYEYECMYCRTMRACVLTSSGVLMFSASERRRWYSSHLLVNPDYLLFGLLAVNLLQDTNYLIARFISKNITIIHSDNQCNLCSITLMFNTTPPF